MKHTHGVISPVSVSLPAFGISAFLSRHSGQFRMSEMTNDYHKLALVVGGQGALLVGSDTVTLSPGVVVRIEPGVAHRFLDDPQMPLALAVLCMTPAATALLSCQAWSALERVLPSGTSRLLSSQALVETRHLLRQIALKGTDVQSHSILRIVGLATQALAAVLDGMETTPPKLISENLASTILWIDTHFTEPIRIDDLAEQAGLSYRAYTQQFRQATGHTVIDYVTRLRIQFVAQCLQATGDILDSSLEAGFSDLSHFYRVFRRHMGTTPREFLLRSTAATQAGENMLY